MKFKVVFFAFLVATILRAEKPAVKPKGEAIALTDGSQYFINPRWSPDAEKIAMTESKYQGIWVLDLKTKSYLQVTDEIGAGFGYTWSKDSKGILCRVSKYERYQRYHAIKIFDIEKNTVQQLTDYRTLMTELPRWTDNDSKVYLASNKGIEIFAFKNKKSNQSIETMGYLQKIFSTEKNDIVIYENKNTIAKKLPVAGECINVVLSPDGTKVAYEIYGGNLNVLNLETNETVDLGVGYRPQWSPDSRKIVFMISEDDGLQITSSDIFVINRDGSGKIKLTNTSELLEQNPSWSPDGKKIVFDEVSSGIIYVIEIE